jgi:membrane-associated phospholipid phosphatase
VSRRPEGDRAALLGTVAALAVALGVSLEVAVGGRLSSLDLRVYSWVMSSGLPSTGWRDPLHGLGRALHAATYLGTREVVPVLGLVVAVVCRHRRTLRPLARFAVLTVLVVLTVQALKVGFGRPPPLAAVTGEDGRAYPSGHTVTAVAYWGLLASVVIELRYPPAVRRLAVYMAVVAPLLTMAGMALLAYHWLSDVLGGAAIGLVLLGVLRVVDAVALTHWRDAGDRVPAAPPGSLSVGTAAGARPAGPSADGGGPAGAGPRDGSVARGRVRRDR